MPSNAPKRMRGGECDVNCRLCNHKFIVTAEEHSIIGGLGGAVAEHLSKKKEHPRQLFIGIEDFYPHAGDYKYLLEQCGLTAEQIKEKILRQVI